MNTDFETLLFSVENGVAQITLNRAESANALNYTMARDLFHAAVACDTNPDVRAVLITNAGKIFCAGGDLRGFAAQDNLPGHIKEMTTFLHGAVSRFVRMDAPVIAAVNGSVGGGGLSLVFASDLVYMVESAFLTMGYTAIGLSPDGSSSYFLPRLVGIRKAIELTLTNRRISADEALAYGIATQVLPTNEACSEAAQAIAGKLALGPTQAFGAAKRLLYGSLNETLETQMELESQSIAALSTSTDAAEGIAAFLEKRKPKFGQG